MSNALVRAADGLTAKPRKSHHRGGGASVIAFGTVLTTASVAVYFLQNALFIDFTAVVAVVLGVNVWRGSRRAAGWSTVLMGYYALTGAAGLVLLLAGLTGYVGAEEIRREHWAWVFPWLATLACWAGVNTLLLWRVWATLRQRERVAKGLCGRCGYDLRATTDRCPECGTDVPSAPAA